MTAPLELCSPSKSVGVRVVIDDRNWFTLWGDGFQLLPISPARMRFDLDPGIRTADPRVSPCHDGSCIRPGQLANAHTITIEDALVAEEMNRVQAAMDLDLRYMELQVSIHDEEHLFEVRVDRMDSDQVRMQVLREVEEG